MISSSVKEIRSFTKKLANRVKISDFRPTLSNSSVGELSDLISFELFWNDNCCSFVVEQRVGAAGQQGVEFVKTSRSGIVQGICYVRCEKRRASKELVVARLKVLMLCPKIIVFQLRLHQLGIDTIKLCGQIVMMFEQGIAMC